MPDPQTVTMVDPQGNAVAVPADSVAAAFSQGFRPETVEGQTSRLVEQSNAERYGGVGGGTVALGAGVLRGVSGGLSDVALAGTFGEEGARDLSGLRSYNPGLSTAGNIAGAVAPALLSFGGSTAARAGVEGVLGAEGLGARALAATPAALTSKLGAKIVGLGEGSGLLGRTAAAIGGGAAEGAIQGAGSYISDVALGDRELSADGFIGGMGHGALWGGAAGGALSISGGALTAARRLFPKQEMTRVAVQQAEHAAATAVRETVEDSEALVATARAKLRERRAVLSMDPAIKAQLDDIALTKARELADSEIAAGRSKAAEAASKAETAAVKAERAKAGPVKRTRKAIAGEDPVPAPTAPAAAVGEEVATDAASLLERQLAGTKAGLDAGESLAGIGARRPGVIGLKPTHVEDALNAHLAKVDPEAAALVRGITDVEDSHAALDTWLGKYGGKTSKVGQFERSQAARETADSWRSKEPGYYSKTPEGEGTAGLSRGREWTFRGSEAEQKAAEDAFYAKHAGGREGLEGRTKPWLPKHARETAEEVVSSAADVAAPKHVDVDDSVRHALGSKVDDIGEDLNDTAAAVGRLEQGHADLADALGDAAPLRSQEKSAAYREAERGAEKSTTHAAAQVTADADKAAATIGLTRELPAGAGKSGIFGEAMKAGDILETLHMLGIPVPDVSRIPIIGPVLKAVLQARVVGKAFGRFGGKVPQTAESVIASKAAAVRQRVYGAVDSMLGAVAKGAQKAAPQAGGAAAILGHVLFDDGEPGKHKASPKGDLVDAYTARLDELNRSAAPGAIFEAVRKRVGASDPALVEAIAAAQERKLQYLNEKAPRPDSPGGILEPHSKWSPSPSELRGFVRIVNATEDPAGVLERVAKGGVVLTDEIDAVRKVYPTLYEDARTRLVTRAVELGSSVPYARRIQLSLLFDVPLDGTMRPDYAAFLQADYQAKPPAPAPAGPMPTPTIMADVNVGARVDPY